MKKFHVSGELSVGIKVPLTETNIHILPPRNCSAKKDDHRISYELRDQDHDSDNEHQSKYSHLLTTKLSAKKDYSLPTCEWGVQCYDDGSEHRANYSHSSAAKPSAKKDDHRIPYELRDQDHDSDNEHQSKYSHLLTTKTHLRKKTILCLHVNGESNVHDRWQ